VVVESGLAVALPEAGTDAAPGTIDTDVAPETFQSKVELPPVLMLEGLAVKERITGNEGGGAAATVTVTC